MTSTLDQFLAADFGNLPEIIRQHAADRPDHPALWQDGQVLTWGELDQIMDRVAAGLQRDGVDQKSAAAICATTSIPYAALFLGCLRAGVAAAPLAPSSTPEQLAGMAADSGATLFFLDKGVAAAMAEVMDGVTARRIALDGSDAGQAFEAPAAFPPREAWNSLEQRSRLRTVKRTGQGPAHVARLGHAVLNVSDFRASEAWYKARFGLITSDEIAAAPGFSIGAFMRCDRGDQPTDHHTLFLLQNPKGPGFNHAAFEVRDLDDLMAGHDHLKAAQRTPAWGVGRHILGSQVFDYWRDPWGHILEHWTDGDLLTADDGSNIASLPDLIGVQWGVPTPPDFG